MANKKCSKKCSVCGKKLYTQNTSGLCIKHFNEFNQKRKKEKYIKKWLESGCLPTSSGPPLSVRNYLLESQNNRCEICGMENEWNNKPLVFILDHINGNSKENKRENLRMICHNCDSQLPTYKNKNKGNGRKYHREYYHKNK